MTFLFDLIPLPFLKTLATLPAPESFRTGAIAIANSPWITLSGSIILVLLENEEGSARNRQQRAIFVFPALFSSSKRGISYFSELTLAGGRESIVLLRLQRWRFEFT